MTLPFDPADERNIRDYAASLTTRELYAELSERMVIACESNNSGLFRVASLLMIEFESRNDSEYQHARKLIAKLREQIDLAVAATHAQGS